MSKLRITQIEKGLMIAELELDGIKTHITMQKERCPLYNTDFDKKIRKALSSIRSSRDILRNDVIGKQLTLTTRGTKMNRHNLWQYNTKPSWTCGFCNNMNGVKRLKLEDKTLLKQTILSDHAAIYK